MPDTKYKRVYIDDAKLMRNLKTGEIVQFQTSLEDENVIWWPEDGGMSRAQYTNRYSAQLQFKQLGWEFVAEDRAPLVFVQEHVFPEWVPATNGDSEKNGQKGFWRVRFPRNFEHNKGAWTLTLTEEL